MASDKEGQSLRATLTYEKELLAITGNVSGSIINEGPVFNDRDREAHQKVEKWLKEQTQLAQSEMQAIIRSLRYLSGELSVQLKLEKTVISLRDTVRVQALADGGTPPYQYAWTDNYGTGKDKSEILFTANQPGEYKVSVTVTDHAGKQVTDTVTLTISGLTAELSMNPSGRKLKLGETRNFNVVVKAGKEAARGPFDYLWQPHPEVTFTPFEGSATTSAAFTKIGPVKVWAQVFQMSEGQKQTVAESDQLELEVVSPKFSLSAEPKDPYVGQEVKVTVASDPALQAPPWDYWWEVSGNTLNAGPISQNREYTFIPKDTNAVTVTVHGKAKEGGTDLGEKKQIVKAKFYEVKVGKPALQGSPPRVWSEKAKGLVELERGIGTFQDFSISADISPKPAAVPLRYQWKVDPEGCSVLSPASRETRANAGQGGSYTFQVTVSDSRDIVLGSGQTDVTITEVTLPAKAQGAADKFNQAKTLAGECKLDQAIPVAEEACQLDPRNKDAARLSQDLKAMKTSMLQYLSQAQSLGQQGKYEEASAALAKAKGLCPSYVPLAAYEWQLQNLQKQKDQQTQQLQQQQQQQKEAKDKADAASKAKQAALDKLKLSGSLAQDGKLDEAISAAEEAAQLDPANPEGARYANYLKSVRDQVLQHLSRAQALGGQGKLA
ncbi:MAG TPA: PKD domain-containing protein, partial [Acidobacteriota bacterium]